jgi:hypothetical protein
MNYQEKYFKYKKKYLALKNLIEQNGGVFYSILDNIRPEIINELKNKINDLDYEVCGHFVLNNEDNYYYPVYSRQPHSRDRKLCVYDDKQKDKDIIFHTHIASSKYYPSIQDLKSSYLKRTNIQMVFTKFGCWIYKSLTPIPRDYSKYHISRVNNKVELELTKFYRTTENGITFNQDAIDTLNTKLTKILKMVGFTIYFEKY